MKYNVIERRIALFLTSFPMLRYYLKYTYKRINFVLSFFLCRSREISSSTPALSRDEKKCCFFGYYGKPQINESGTTLLCAANFDGRIPGPGDKLKLLYGHVSEKKYHQFSSSWSWNWQQGCMLQWMSRCPGEVVIYNDYRENRFISIMRDVQKGIMNQYEIPIYAISKSNDFALSLDFSRLYKLRSEYGYCNDRNYMLKEMAPDNNGIWFLDLKTGRKKLILTLRQLLEFRHRASMKHAYHKANHIEISPDDRRFMFLHRWIYKKRKYTRLLTANIDGSDIHLVCDCGMVSHCSWKNNHQILAWARLSTLGERYYLFDDKLSQFSIMGENILTEDGHPSFSPDTKMIITDTYPDKFRMRSLILYDVEKNKKIIFWRYFAPLRYDGKVRCDLHPRWSIDGKYITFDSCHENVRKSYVIDFEMVKEK